MEAERLEVIVPEFVCEFGAALQGRFPIGLRVVYPSAAIAAYRIWKTIDLHFALSALGRIAYERHHDLHQLFGRPLERFVNLLITAFCFSSCSFAWRISSAAFAASCSAIRRFISAAEKAPGPAGCVELRFSDIACLPSCLSASHHSRYKTMTEVPPSTAPPSALDRATTDASATARRGVRLNPRAVIT
ncbi:MAG: hypothetical protein WA709_06745, partial [Stellaceae bacterium]